MKKVIHPQLYSQNRNVSNVTSEGLYDFDNLSQQDIDLITEVLYYSVSGKYDSKLQALGLLNETYGIMYAPRYILLMLITKMYGQSQKALDCLAVACSYAKMGAAYRNDAIHYYEIFLTRASSLNRIVAQQSFTWLSDCFLYDEISTLYEAENNLYRALKYAEMAENKNTQALPHYPIHISKILLKISPQEALDFLSRCIENTKYQPCVPQLQKELLLIQDKIQKGYTYKNRHRSTVKTSIDDHIENAAQKFLPGGCYYTLWHK